MVLSPPSHTLRIEFQAAARIVAVQWAGACEASRLRHVYRCVTELLRRTAARRILFDHRDREPITADDAHWVATEAYSELLADQAGVLRLAYVVPAAIYESYDPGHRQTVGELLHIALFRQPAEAVAWLLAE